MPKTSPNSPQSTWAASARPKVSETNAAGVALGRSVRTAPRSALIPPRYPSARSTWKSAIAERAGSSVRSAWIRAWNGVSTVVRGAGGAGVRATLRRRATLRTLSRWIPRWRAIWLDPQRSA